MKRVQGFTLLEVLVALVIVAFGMGAVLSALSSSADNIASLRDKTVAQWVAMNQIADVRLNLNAPQTGVSEGDVKNFGGSDWHWRQDVMAVQMVPGMLEIAVRVRRIAPGSSATKSSASNPAARATSSAGGSRSGLAASTSSSSGAPSTFFSSGSGGFSSSSGFGAGSSGALALGLQSSGGSNRNIGATQLPATTDDQHWTATAIGFRGDAVAAANGENPDWQSCNNGNSATGTTNSSGLCTSSSSSGTTSGTVASPNNGTINGSTSGSQSTSGSATQ